MSEYEPLPDLSYLSDERFHRYGRILFGTMLKLPVMAAILETTPTLHETFRGHYITQLIDANSGDVVAELGRLRRVPLIEQRVDTNPYGRVYRRLDSPMWDITRASINAARTELDL